MFFPLLDLNITPEEYGSISVFDFISYFVLFFTLEDFFRFSKMNKSYYHILLIFNGDANLWKYSIRIYSQFNFQFL